MDLLVFFFWQKIIFEGNMVWRLSLCVVVILGLKKKINDIKRTFTRVQRTLMRLAMVQQRITVYDNSRSNSNKRERQEDRKRKARKIFQKLSAFPRKIMNLDFCVLVFGHKKKINSHLSSLDFLCSRGSTRYTRLFRLPIAKIRKNRRRRWT